MYPFMYTLLGYVNLKLKCHSKCNQGWYFLRTLIFVAKSYYVCPAKILIRIKGHTTILNAPNNKWKYLQRLLHFIEPHRNAHLKTFIHKKTTLWRNVFKCAFPYGSIKWNNIWGNYQSLLGVFINHVFPWYESVY